jgi:alkanesulfonate monooxygenase SsuD/methylene tetrahydromethanopterin reductase-like flavin-dependent oxidoreductase (luciferase family)
MKFSLFFEMQISEPTRASEAQCFLDCAEQAVLADEIGYHAVWEVEHHGLREYSHSSAPEVFLAYVAAKTKRIRLGHGITLTPKCYNHPIRIAERVATLDILSGGRVNWGSGKSNSLTEQKAFEGDIPNLHAQWREALEIIPRAWQEEVLEYKGQFWQIPPTQVVPKPVQRPHPPMYAACSKPDSAAEVGKVGIGALNFAIGNDEYLAKKVRDYRAAIETARPTHYQKTNWFACTPVSHCDEDDRTACAWGMRGARFFGQALATYYTPLNRPIGPIQVDRSFLKDDELSDMMESRGAPDAPAMSVVGDPSHCREIVSRFKDAGIDELILVMQAGTIPHDRVLRSIRTFGDKVMPHFA